ncbi:MAG: DUF721 domain-containing protein [Desulfovibrionaceae bacterium]
MKNLYELYASLNGTPLPRRCKHPWAARILLENVLRGMGMRDQSALRPLWEHWDMAMGPLAGMAWPLGHRERTLLIGGEDAMMLQELHFLKAEILERANGFLGRKYFLDAHVSLLLGRRPLNVPPAPPAPQRRHRQELPPPSGKYLAQMDPASPVTRAYARFVRRGRH